MVINQDDIISKLQEFYDLNKEAITNFIVVIGLIIFLWIFWSFMLRRVKDHLSPGQYNAMRTLGRATILFLGILWLFGEEFFIGAAALLGTAIGFASSTTIGNFISGLFLLVTNPFSVGDYVMLPKLGVEGIVEEISINYTIILTPQGIRSIISNKNLLGTTIQNTRIVISEKDTRDTKITWRDHENDKFDSLEDVVDIFAGIRARYSSKKKTYYLYPLVYSLNADKYKHSLSKGVLNEVVEKFSDRTEEKISWVLLNRSNYQLNLIVEDPYSLFDLKNEILGYLEERMEAVHQ
ncbi:MAG: mechanosensitive ion channel domain-containing protein [Candidatus Hodarchaeales archaeon]